MKIFLSPPHMGGNEQTYINKAFKTNYIAPLGENVVGFESDIAKFSGAKHALALSSGTAAIHLALRVLGIQAGDYVAASTFTFIGSISPITFVGAEPIFVDSEIDSWNADPNLVEDTFKRYKPKAFILTHLYGQMAKIDEIYSLCKRYGVLLIEDAAESLGATFDGKQSGTFGTIGIYSFNGNKIITTSGGGAMVSDDEALIKKASFYSTQARENFAHYEHYEIGYNYRMSNVLAGIGRGQMEVLGDRIRQKRTIFDYYKANLPELEYMPEVNRSIGNRWLTTALLDGVEPEKVRQHLVSKEIESRALWKPMHLQKVFSGAKVIVNGTSEKLFNRGICLPSGTALTNEQLDLIIASVKEVI